MHSRIIKKMFRVLFRVIKICIHIKETLQLEFVFRKGNESLVGKDLYPLVDGVSNINTTTEFLITKSDPTFDLHVNFTFKKVKRQAGFIHVDLREWMEGGSYQQIRKLEKAPGGKALIEFGFIFFDSGVDPLPKSLQSFEVFEKSMNQKYRAQISEQNILLTQKLKELTNLKESLTGQKQNYSQIEAQFEKFQAQIDEQVFTHSKKMNEVETKLKEQQEKQAFLMELVNKSGSEDLLNYVKGLHQVETTMESQGNQTCSN